MFTYFFGCDISVTISRFMLLGLVAMLPFVGGCGEDDNPIVDDHNHGEAEPFHADADGFILEVDGVEVYRQFQGEHTGGLMVGVGEEIEVHVAFLDPNESEFHPGEMEEEHETEGDHEHHEEETFALGLIDYDTTIADVRLHEDVEEHEDHEAGEKHEDEEHADGLIFEVIGVKAGTTEIKLQLLHGDHADFTAALAIPVTVQ